MGEYDEYDESETPELVNPSLPQTPNAPWSWTPTRIAYVAGGIVAVGFIAWFVMEYNGEKAKAIAKAVGND